LIRDLTAEAVGEHLSSSTERISTVLLSLIGETEELRIGVFVAFVSMMTELE
jgi:hypothetical protein